MATKELSAEEPNNKSILEEFKEFIARGNVIELAVGLTVGAAFTRLINSLVNDVIMPPIGLVLNNVNFSELYLNLGEESYETLALAESAGAPIIRYGQFITNVIDFLIVAIVIFLVIKAVNSIKRKELLKNDLLDGQFLQKITRKPASKEVA